MPVSNIDLEINGVLIEAEIDYTYSKGYPPKLQGDPDYQYEGCADEWELTVLMLKDVNDEFTVDVSGLIEYIEDELIEQVIFELESE